MKNISVSFGEFKNVEAPILYLNEDIINYAKHLIKINPEINIAKDKVSNIDVLTGVLGELVFAQWFYGDYECNYIGTNKGAGDFIKERIEIKASSHCLDRINYLMVKKEYAEKRTPFAYVQIAIEIDYNGTGKKPEPRPGNKAVICGFCYGENFTKIAEQFIQGSYNALRYPIRKLNPVSLLSFYYKNKNFCRKHELELKYNKNFIEARELII